MGNKTSKKNAKSEKKVTIRAESEFLEPLPTNHTLDDSFENSNRSNTDNENSRRSILTYESQSGISRHDLQDESAAKKLDKALDLLAQISNKSDSPYKREFDTIVDRLQDVQARVLHIEIEQNGPLGELERINETRHFLLEAQEDDLLRPEERTVAAWITQTILTQPGSNGRDNANSLDNPPPLPSLVNGPSINTHMRASKQANPISQQILGLEAAPGLAAELNRIRDWNFNIFTVYNAAGEDTLALIAKQIVHQQGYHMLGVDLNLFLTFMSHAGASYHSKNPYHNACHAADTLVTQYYFLKSVVFETCTKLDAFASLCAAACHDIDHPGRDNAFQMKTNSNLALMYNDFAVLEMHHACFGWRLFKEYDFLQKLSKKQRKRFRHVFLKCILATDNSKHTSLCGVLENDIKKPQIENGDWAAPDLNQESMQILLSVAVHSADISNPTRPLDLHRQWANKIMEEFFSQGDEERKKGLDIQPGCDRDTADICSVQLGFINFVVAPWFELWKTIMPDLGDVFLQQLDENKIYWGKQVADVMDAVSEDEAEEPESIDPELPDPISAKSPIPTNDPLFSDSPSLRVKRSDRPLPRRSILFGDEIEMLRKSFLPQTQTYSQRSTSLQRYSTQGSVFQKKRSSEDRTVRRIASSPTASLSFKRSSTQPNVLGSIDELSSPDLLMKMSSSAPHQRPSIVITDDDLDRE